MTLIVSLRTLDGIVIAGDSLSTLMRSAEIQGDVDVICPSCGHQHVIQATLQGPALPATTLSYAQKIFPFMTNFGIGTYGAGQVNSRTIYFAIRELEAEMSSRSESEWPQRAEEVAQFVGEGVLEMLRQQATAENFNLNTWADDYVHIGLQVVGYDDDQPVTYEVRIGKNLNIQQRGGLDVTITGMIDVFNALYGLYQANPQSVPMIEHFSLQDAISYAEFLIKTTALHQQFSRVIPSVGGDIDVAVVTPFGGFGWIKQKPLFHKLAQQETENYEEQEQSEGQTEGRSEDQASDGTAR